MTITALDANELLLLLLLLVIISQVLNLEIWNESPAHWQWGHSRRLETVKCLFPFKTHTHLIFNFISKDLTSQLTESSKASKGLLGADVKQLQTQLDEKNRVSLSK